MKLFTYINVSTTFLVSATLFSSATLSAKENPPEPLQNPGECPIDLPVRVASLESLRHFEGLIGHCPETSVIESPALEANRPRATIKAEDGPPAWQIPPQRGPRETDFKSPDKKDARTRMIASRDGSQVAIRPGSSAWQSGSQLASVSDSAAPAQASAGSEEDAEAVLALRPRSYTTVFDQTISTAARTHQVDPLLLHAVIKQESGYRPQATSHAGARGLMQVMPGTGRMLGVRDAGKLYDPGTNVDAGAKLLSQLWQRFDGNLDLVLAAYNAGEGAVRKYGNTVPPYRETRDYVVKVKANYRKLAAESGLAVDF